MAYTDGATQASSELPILQCLRSGGTKTCQEIIRLVRNTVKLSPAALAPKKSRNGEPQFHAIVRNSLEDRRKGNLFDKGFVKCVERDAYRITDSGVARMAEIIELNDMLNELLQGKSLD